MKSLSSKRGLAGERRRSRHLSVACQACCSLTLADAGKQPQVLRTYDYLLPFGEIIPVVVVVVDVVSDIGECYRIIPIGKAKRAIAP